jgi:hypothetical protein
VLRSLADAGKTILLTIHQPSLEVFKLMDNLVLVGKDKGSAEPGRLAYYGPAYPDAVRFFNPDGVSSSRPGVEPSPDEVLRGLAKRPTAEWAERYQRSSYAKELVRDRAGGPPTSESAVGAEPVKVSAWSQWGVLIRRGLAIKLRDRMNTVILLAQAPIVAVLLVIVFGREVKGDVAPEKWAAVSGSLGTTLFLMALAALWFGASNAVREVVGEWAVYHRERMVNLRIVPYVGSKFAVLGGLCLVQCLTLLAITDAGCDFKAPWLGLLGVLLLSALVGTALGLVLSALARTSEVAIALLPIVLLPMVILGGAIQPAHKMHRFSRLLCQVVPTRWAFEGLVVLEAGHRPLSPAPTDEAKKDMAEAYFPKETHRAPAWAPPAILGGMLALGAVGVGGVLRRRDVH